jgi:hypothetical protein
MSKEIIKWLEDEIEWNRPAVEGEVVLSDGTHDIHVGRMECAESLLNQIREKGWCKK